MFFTVFKESKIFRPVISDNFVDMMYSFFGVSDWQTASSQDANSIDTDPQLGGNYDIPAGSPAKDAGLTISTVRDDYRGLARPQGSAYDIGAMEFCGVLSFNGVDISGLDIN